MSFIGKRQNNCVAADSSTRITTDFHAHVLPDIDDGSKSVNESLEMLRMSYESGVRRIVATPHFYARYQNPESFMKKRAEAIALLAHAMENGRNNGDKYPEIILGAEVAYFDGISYCEEIRTFCVQGTRMVLVEMPFQRWDDRIINEMHDMKSSLNVIPVVAHVDRYFKTQSAKMIKKLLDDDLLVQANASSFINRQSRNRMMKWLLEDEIDFIGSDCHNTTCRQPNLDRASQAISCMAGDKILTKINGFCDYVFNSTEVLTD